MATRDPADAWFIRLPDGHVLRAKSIAAVRHHIETGRIPVDSLVRRASEEDWITLDWAVEFADLTNQKRKRTEALEETPRKNDTGPVNKEAPPRNQHELRTVGVPGMVEELLTALDSTVNRRKLLVAGAASLTGSILLVVLTLLDSLGLEQPWPWVYRAVTALVLLTVTGISTALLTQMTFVELSRLRTARWSEATARLPQFALRIMGCYLAIVGGVFLATTGLHRLPEWILSQEADWMPASELLAALATALGLVLEVFLWPMLGLALLLGPIPVVEECGIGAAIRQWWALIRRHVSRVFFYEALAAALGGVMTIPFLFPVLLAGWLSIPDHALVEVTRSTLTILAGVAVTPLVAYLLVANVFIYLNLRYEIAPGVRE